MSWFSKSESDQPEPQPIHVQHVPGLADSLLGELAPLLAAEGVDLNDPDLDPADLDRALESAQEQYNLGLFTPTGVHRDLSLAVLRRFTEAVSARRDDEAQAVLDAVETEETDTTPAISHLIGVSLGLLDTWYSDRRYRAALSETRVASRRREVRAAATDVLSAARRRKAFDSLHDLTLRHGGLGVYEGAATVVAASVSAIATRARRPVADVCRELLTDDDAAIAAVPLAAAPREDDVQERLSAGEERLIREFGGWLSRQEEIAAPSFEDEIRLFGSLFAVSHMVGADLTDPDGIPPLVDALLDMGANGEPDSHDAMMSCLLTIDEYIHFQWEVSRHPEDWDEVHDLVEETLEESAVEGADGLDLEALAEVRTAARAVDEDLRRSALAATRVSAAVTPFLDWLGSSRAITASGFLRLADIEPVAAMLGVRAQGVRQRPDQPFPGLVTDLSAPLEDPEIFYAQSMKEVPVLRAWWAALQHVGIIELTKTRVRPGPRAEAWRAADVPPLELAEPLNGVFSAWSLVQQLDEYDLFGMEKVVVVLAGGLLLAAAAPGVDLGLPDPRTSPFGELLAPRALQKLARLASVGLLVGEKDGRFTVPEPLRAALLPAAVAALTAPAADDGGDEDWLRLFPV